MGLVVGKKLALWNEFIGRYHYLGYGVMPGAQLRYFIMTEERVLGAMGFGFVEVGTVTPLPQGGNPKPRMFRLPKAKALINRLGFNNHGLDAFVRNVQTSALRREKNPALLLGLNIGKNAATPIENVCTRRPASACIMDTTRLESMPPERKTPTGTSLIIWLRTTRARSPANSS